MTSKRATHRSLVNARGVAIGLWLVAAAGGLTIVITAIAGADPAAVDFVPAILMFACIALDGVICTTVGALIVTRRPNNLVGWLLALLGVGLGLTFGGFGVAGVRTTLAGPDDLLTGLALWTGVGAFNPTLMLVGLVMLLFPDGRPPSPRWKGPIGAIVVTVLAASAVIAVKPGLFDSAMPSNPFGVDHLVIRTLAPIALAAASIGALGSILLGAIAVGWRFLKARGDTRQQMKWFLGAVAIVALMIVPQTVMGTTPVTQTADVEVQAFGFSDVVGSASLALLPISIGVAILRYRLYDIDRLISRTVGWAVSTVVLVGVFGTGIVAIQAALSGVTQGQTIAVAASTLAALALFQPVRHRVQAAVDRRFDRARYDAAMVIEGFSARLRDELELGMLRDDILRVATDAVRPAMAGIWLRPGTGRQGRIAGELDVPTARERR